MASGSSSCHSYSYFFRGVYHFMYIYLVNFVVKYILKYLLWLYLKIIKYLMSFGFLLFGKYFLDFLGHICFCYSIVKIVLKLDSFLFWIIKTIDSKISRCTVMFLFHLINSLTSEIFFPIMVAKTFCVNHFFVSSCWSNFPGCCASIFLL